MPFLDVPGASIYYEVHGAGPWLVFAHGAGGNHLTWWQQIPAFADRFRCVTYAQRGWGRSACDGEPDPALFADDLEALLDHLGADRAALVGQSMGGWSVYGCTLKRPERVSHLVLTSTLAGLTDDAMIMQLLELHDPDAPFDGTLALAESFIRENPAMTFLMGEVAGLNQPMTPDFLRALIALRYPPEPARLAMPILYLSGARDRLFPLAMQKAARAKLPRSQLVVVEDAGHSIYWERPEAFNAALADFLKQ